MTLMLISILWKTLATAAVVIVAGRVAQRVGPVLTSVLITLPFNAGPGFFFVSLDASDAFVREGALIAFATTGAVLVFCTAWVWAERWGGYLLSATVGIAGWFGITFLVHQAPMTIPFAFAVVGAGALFAWLCRRRDLRKPEGVSAAAGWSFLVVRGVAAGLVVALVATASPWLGPVWSGFALGFPTTLLASAWMLYGHYGRTFGAATLNAAQPSLVVYASFVLALHLLTGPLPATVAVVVSFIGSSVMAAGLAAIVSRRRRRAAPL
jgi:uncharacterized membrane protein